MTQNLLDEQQKHSHAATNISAEFEFYHQCYDATLALAIALNNTIEGECLCLYTFYFNIIVLIIRTESFE